MPTRRREQETEIKIVPTDKELEAPEGLIEAVDHLKAFVESVVYDHAADDTAAEATPDETPPEKNE